LNIDIRIKENIYKITPVYKTVYYAQNKNSNQNIYTKLFNKNHNIESIGGNENEENNNYFSPRIERFI
jgi:hypothetical protein